MDGPQATSAAELSSAPEPLSLSPETDSSNSYSIAETRNLNVPVVHVDSGLYFCWASVTHLLLCYI